MARAGHRVCYVIVDTAHAYSLASIFDLRLSFFDFDVDCR